MELKKFIKYTLEQIFEAVIETQQTYTNKVISINPPVIYKNETDDRYVPYEGREYLLQEIEFDILLGRTNESGAEGGIGVFFAPVTLGAKGKSGNINQETTRVKFSIPVRFPVDKEYTKSIKY